MTFLLVTVVYAVAISKPGHGNIGPLAVVRQRVQPGRGDVYRCLVVATPEPLMQCVTAA